jgi:hypothetical protein
MARELYKLRDKVKQIRELCKSEIEMNEEQIKLLTDGTQEYCEGRLEFAIEVLKIAVDLDMNLHFEEPDEYQMLIDDGTLVEETNEG